MQHLGDLIVTGREEVSGQVTGTIYVRDGGDLILWGQASGGVIIDAGGTATIHGQSSRDVNNEGELTLYGQVSGRVLGNPPVNRLGPNQIVGIENPVPFTGITYSFTLP